MAVRYRVPSLSSRERQGTLVHVDATASPVTRRVECLAEVTDDDPAVRPGFFATASVETRRAHAMAVPESALQPGESGWSVFVVVGGKASRRDVAVGMRTKEGLVELTSGVAEGDLVVVKGGNVLANGSAVDASGPKAGP
jgi:multidrug efflux system membrane fusion protein